MDNNSITLLSTAYFPPIQWFKEMLYGETVILEKNENYIKQTFRNRCEIASANGKQSLTIPITHDNTKIIKDIKISNHSNWQHQHIYTLQSSYGESPFFEYYIDDILPIFNKKFKYLYDLNTTTINTCISLLGIEKEIKHTSVFEKEYTNVNDKRWEITPKSKQNTKQYTSKTYYQVFISKHGFIPNLSILDLIFNQGTESLRYI